MYRSVKLWPNERLRNVIRNSEDRENLKNLEYKLSHFPTDHLLRARWANRGADFDVDRRFPAQYYIVGCDFKTHRRVDHAPTDKRKTRLFYFVPFVRGIWALQRSENGLNLSGKNKKFGKKEACSPFCLHMRFKYEVHFFIIKTRKNWAGRRRKKKQISRTFLFYV